MTVRRTFLLYCPATDQNITDVLGRANYSYYFVLKRFTPLLAELGDVRPLPELGQLDAAVAEVRSAGGEPVLMLFAPPHETVLDPPCPVVPVFAWEFDTIPDEEFGGDSRSNWAQVLSGAGMAITHSEFAVASVRRSLGEDFPIWSLPAPSWDGFAAIEGADWTGDPVTLTLDGTVLDSWELGLREDPASFDQPEFTSGQRTLEVSGVVFSSVFNPHDKRKNWYDLLTGFVWAFRDNPDATLVLKLVHVDRDESCWMILKEMLKLAPYQCRVVAVHGYLEQPAFHDLVRATTYTVNASAGEGQCLPLMEFMSAGKPAIAPNHTAMADYVTPANSFIVSGTREPSAWPQDPRQVFRCMRYRINWGTVRDAYLAAFAVATDDPDRYRAMSADARSSLQAHCSHDVIVAGLEAALAHVPTVTASGVN